MAGIAWRAMVAGRARAVIKRTVSGMATWAGLWWSKGRATPVPRHSTAGQV